MESFLIYILVCTLDCKVVDLLIVGYFWWHARLDSGNGITGGRHIERNFDELVHKRVNVKLPGLWNMQSKLQWSASSWKCCYERVFNKWFHVRQPPADKLTKGGNISLWASCRHFGSIFLSFVSPVVKFPAHFLSSRHISSPPSGKGDNPFWSHRLINLQVNARNFSDKAVLRVTRKSHSFHLAACST